MQVLLLLSLTMWALLVPSETQQTYHTLVKAYKTAIREGIQNVHQTDAKYHFNFVGIPKQPKLTGHFLEIQFHLKATKCANLDKNEHRDECEFWKKRPLINCMVCGNLNGDDLKSTFVDCQRQSSVDATYREENCIHSENYVVGGGHTLGLKKSSSTEFECLGCF